MRFCSPPFGFIGVLAAGTLALVGCEISCPPNMTAPPAFTVAFSTDTLAAQGGGFRRAELRSAYLIRYTTATFQQPLDTLRQPSLPASASSTKPFFAIYFPAQGPAQFSVPPNGPSFLISYRLMVPSAGRSYDISNIAIEQAPGSGRCDGYRITRREATINGQLRDGLNQPPELTK
ncbi:MAG: hypothetical protein JWR44_105 [Hymenobacter sp.]|jgi:hypothetical protein|nr:hypothetical protein [Hymenobacter sp.]